MDVSGPGSLSYPILSYPMDMIWIWMEIDRYGPKILFIA